MVWTVFSSQRHISRKSRDFAASALLLALTGCEAQTPQGTGPDVNEVFSCASDGYVDCDNDAANGCETNPKTDKNNCGACGISCTSPRVCMEGTCDFDNTECSPLSLATHPEHCGACGKSVTDWNACTMDSCVDGKPVHTNLPAGTMCDGGSCDADGHCLLENGKPCLPGNYCMSGFCIDGTCCDKACDGLCESCRKSLTAIADGQCQPILYFTDPANECPNSLCNGAGQCTDPPITCTTPADCPSGFCADGYCCNSPCMDSCMVCNAPYNLGVCVPVPLFDTDPNATVPCSGPMVACNGDGVCKGELGQSCVMNSNCLSGHCDAGLCGFGMMQMGPRTWEWHVDESVYGDMEQQWEYADASVSEMVATNDGRVKVTGIYSKQIFGMPSGGTDTMPGHSMGYTHDHRGPHLFAFDLDANAQTGTMNQIFDAADWFDKLSTTEFAIKRWYSKGLKLWLTGGHAGLYFEGWKYTYNSKVFTTSDECNSGWFGVSGPSSWSLGGAGACALQAWTLAGDEAGNTFARSAAGISLYDQVGQVQQVIPDPFSGPEGKVTIGPQGEFHLGARDSSAVRISKADASGILQWSKTLLTPLEKGHEDCFSHTLDAVGNLLLAFHSQNVVHFGNGPLPRLGPLDLILAKLDPQGNLIWVKRFGSQNFTVKSCSLKRTGLDELALLLDSTGTVDLGDGVLPSSPVLVKFDAMGSLLWHADLLTNFPFAPESHSWAIAGHPSGAIFVSGTGHEPTPQSSGTPRMHRFLAAKYGP